jgi:hypothetical protein
VELREDMLEDSVRAAEESFRKIRLFLEPKNVLLLHLDDESELGDCDFDLLKFHTMVFWFVIKRLLLLLLLLLL